MAAEVLIAGHIGCRSKSSWLPYKGNRPGRAWPTPTRRTGQGHLLSTCCRKGSRSHGTGLSRVSRISGSADHADPVEVADSCRGVDPSRVADPVEVGGSARCWTPSPLADPPPPLPGGAIDLRQGPPPGPGPGPDHPRGMSVRASSGYTPAAPQVTVERGRCSVAVGDMPQTAIARPDPA